MDRNRKDSLQLLRVQNDLNSLALAMRDILDAREPYPLTAWTAQFERIRGDLAAALKIEDAFAPAQRTADQIASNTRRFVDSVVEGITRYLEGDFSKIVNPEALTARQARR